MRHVTALSLVAVGILLAPTRAQQPPPASAAPPGKPATAPTAPSGKPQPRPGATQPSGAAQPGAGKGPAAGSPPAQPASRAEAVPIYASALRYFDRAVSDAEARKTAAVVIAESVKLKIDARLVVAVMGAEHWLARPAPGKSAARPDSSAAPAAVARRIQALAAELNRVTPGQPPVDAALEALSRRGSSAAVRRAAGVTKPEEYAKKVLRLYRQMLPENERTWNAP